MNPLKWSSGSTGPQRTAQQVTNIAKTNFNNYIVDNYAYVRKGVCSSNNRMSPTFLDEVICEATGLILTNDEMAMLKKKLKKAPAFVYLMSNDELNVKELEDTRMCPVLAKIQAGQRASKIEKERAKYCILHDLDPDQQYTDGPGQPLMDL